MRSPCQGPRLADPTFSGEKSGTKGCEQRPAPPRGGMQGDVLHASWLPGLCTPGPAPPALLPGLCTPGPAPPALPPRLAPGCAPSSSPGIWRTGQAPGGRGRDTLSLPAFSAPLDQHPPEACQRGDSQPAAQIQVVPRHLHATGSPADSDPRDCGATV